MLIVECLFKLKKIRQNREGGRERGGGEGERGRDVSYEIRVSKCNLDVMEVCLGMFM